MNKFILILIFISISFQFVTNVNADFYEYVDANGKFVLTDNAGNIPENQRSKKNTLREQRDIPSKSLPIIHSGNTQSRMTEEEERYLADLKKRGASEEQIQYFKCMLKVKREADKVWSEKEKKELDSLLRSTWNQMRNALGHGDVDTAVSYFLVETRETYRKMYSSFPKQMLSEMSQELNNIQMVKVRGNHSAIYEILCIRDGKTFSFQLEFVRNCDDEWKIKSY
jgi:hypothetical protein